MVIFHLLKTHNMNINKYILLLACLLLAAACEKKHISR